MSDIKDKYVVEYSVQGRTVHIDSVEQMLKQNIQNVAMGIINDYKPVAICDSYDEAMKQADEFEAALKKHGR